jgi:hypothetical protein
VSASPGWRIKDDPPAAVAGGLFSLLGCLAVLAACSGVTREVEVVGAPLATRPPSCPIEVLAESPDRSYRVVANIDAYVRRNKVTGGPRGVLDDALPELRKQGCAAGADAVVVLNQTVSQSGEFKLLYVKAVAIQYAPAPRP